MPNWMTATQLTARYAVSERRLLDYSFRGNLPMLRDPDGTTRFDEREVAQLFPPRAPGIYSAPAPSGPHMGVLGSLRMGDDTAAHSSPLPALNPREMRRRNLRLNGDQSARSSFEPRKTGTNG